MIGTWRFVLGLLSGGLVVGWPLIGWARIGESAAEVEQRFTQPDKGRIYRFPKDMPERERERLLREVPIRQYDHLLPKEGWEEVIYWKSAIDGQLDREDGWRVHVFFYNGRSVYEAYRRVGPSLNEFEVRAILNFNRSGQTWRRLEGEAVKASESLLGYTFELGDPATPLLRARQQGEWLIIYHATLDARLNESKRRWDESEAVRREGERRRQAETAPASVDGF
jgi:hypothetical protein